MFYSIEIFKNLRSMYVRLGKFFLISKRVAKYFGKTTKTQIKLSDNKR